MELLQLKYFCDAATSENFSKTAKKFGVPPSDISQSIRRLERELGVQLFSRRANSISINDSGREFYHGISRALDVISETVTNISGKEEKEKIKICINANRRVLMEIVEKYTRTYPSVEIITTHFTDPTSDDFDIIIESDDEKLSSYIKRLMLSEEILLAMKRDGRYENVKSVDISNFVNEPFVTMSEKSSLYKITNRICNDYGFSPRIAIRSDDPFYVRKCVELGLGVTFVPSVSWQGQFSDDVVLLSVNGYHRDTYVYTNPEKQKPLAVRRFLDML